MRKLILLLAILTIPQISFATYELLDFTCGGATHAEGGNYEVWGSCVITCGKMSGGDFVLNGGYYYIGVDDHFPGINQIIFSLSQNYPNPFKTETSIKYSLPKSGNVKIQIYNVRGQLVETLIDRPIPAGIHTVYWDGEDMSSGIYFCKLDTDNGSITKKMLLVR
ncbi:MAG: T9SS type A sorting domain-containing protein [Candidatus Cloacimonetes bacterium]|nr:T9SS type A sorting domain-containing protein [Candidatus Cloacimonadota bacterium]